MLSAFGLWMFRQFRLLTFRTMSLRPLDFSILLFWHSDFSVGCILTFGLLPLPSDFSSHVISTNYSPNVISTFENCKLKLYFCGFITPSRLGSACFGTLWSLLFTFYTTCFSKDHSQALGFSTEMRIWSISLIYSDWKWCIHLSRSLYLNLDISKVLL